MVEANKGIIVVTNSRGVPFDFRTSHATIAVNGSRIRVSALSADKGQPVSVRFLSYASGDIAQNIIVGKQA
jgi:hypothetical protein